MAWCLATWFIRVPLSGPGASIITWNFLRKRQLPTMTSSNPVPRILGLSGRWVSARWDPGKTMSFSRKTRSSKNFECYYFRFSGYDSTSLKSTSFPESLLLYFHGNEAGAKSLTPFALCGKIADPWESHAISRSCVLVCFLTCNVGSGIVLHRILQSIDRKKFVSLWWE